MAFLPASFNKTVVEEESQLEFKHSIEMDRSKKISDSCKELPYNQL